MPGNGQKLFRKIKGKPIGYACAFCLEKRVMDIYSKKSRWKIYLAIFGVIIVLASLIYTNYLASKLAREERAKVNIWQEATRYNTIGTEDEGLELSLKIVQSNNNIPAMIVGEGEHIDSHINFPSDDPQYLKRELDKMKRSGNEPIVIEDLGVSIYYKESYILRQLRFFPFIQLLLIGAFILFGYLSFSSARRAEQNRVWVGMAKETAHQLGTPISAIIAWLEHLRMIREGDEEILEVVDELQNDVNRLDLVADRFSKIGSEPELMPVNVYDVLEESRAYMERRAPKRVSFDFPEVSLHPAKTVFINVHLFNWVVENLLRNALDAMGGRGKIAAQVYEEPGYISIDIKDSGKGIPASKFKTVFEPGYTTKKRGWGLGLSLARRIINEYHSGKIFVKDSTEGEGTIFTIKLPVKSPKKESVKKANPKREVIL